MAKAVVAVLVLFLFVVKDGRGEEALSPDFYMFSCPNVADIVHQIVGQAVEAEPRMAGSLLRLHFHDCFVNGCDGSILLDDTPHKKGEKTSPPNRNSIRGFEVIDSIKAAVEEACFSTVSCADIIALAAQASVTLTGGPSWRVLLGRRDSTRASFRAPAKSIPAPNGTLSSIITKFEAVGLSAQDVVVLSGAHTIGRARCATFGPRLYNFKGSHIVDSTIETSFLVDLQGVCPKPGTSNTLAPLDSSTKDIFDNNYFINLQSKKGLLQSDQELFSAPQDITSSLVEKYSTSQSLFFMDFVTSMVKMGNIKLLTGDKGEIRLNCRKVNENHFK